jgi:hypothetical protein
MFWPQLLLSFFQGLPVQGRERSRVGLSEQHQPEE